MKNKLAALAACAVLAAQTAAIPSAARAASKASLVVDVTSGRVLESNNASARLPMASTTKIMTCIIAIETGDLESVVTVSKYAASISGSTMNLKEGDRVPLGDLVVGMMFVSGNDAAVAVAEHLSGSVEAFAEVMNLKAAKLGCEDTHFVNPHGLSNPEHYTTASDLARISCHALKNETFLLFVSSKTYPVEINGVLTEFTNRDQFLVRYPYAKGVKTGTTSAAGRCFVSAAEKDGLFLCGVVLNSSDIYGESEAMMSRCFDAYGVRILARKGEFVASIPVSGGQESSYGYEVEDTVSVPVRKDGTETVSIEFAFPEKLQAPVDYRQKIGLIIITVNGQRVMERDALARRSVLESGHETEMLLKQLRDLLSEVFG